MSLVRLSVGVVAVLVAAALGASAVTRDDLLQVLQTNGIPFDPVHLEQVAVESVLSAVDPHARILTVEEATSMRERQTVALAELWTGGIGYLRVDGCFAGGGTQVTDPVASWRREGLWGLIIDLRQAGGDDLDTLDALAGMMVPEGVDLYTVEDGSGTIVETRHSRRDGMLPGGMPVMVLVDDGTSCAAETLAVVVKHRGGVMLIGTPTAGERVVRDVVELSGDERLYVATRRLMPVGLLAELSFGVRPDIELDPALPAVNPVLPVGDEPDEVDGSEADSDEAGLSRRVRGDPALGRAVDILLGLKALDKPAAAHAAEK